MFRRPFWLRLLVVLCVYLGSHSPGWAADDDEEDPRPLPGLTAKYFSANQSQPTVVRYDATPALLLAAGETPDPRLETQGWRVEWSGILQVLHPGKHRFGARASGRLEVNVAGKSVLAGQGDDLQGPEVDFPFGRYPVTVKFAPTGPGADLKIYWQAEAFPREPLPSFAVGHPRKEKPLTVDLFPLGRLAAEEHSCVACHLPDKEISISRQLLQRLGPKLTDAGSRLKAAWIYHWLDNPADFRPEAVMPRLFGSGRIAETERYAVANFLSTRGKPLEPEKEIDPKAIKRNVTAGEQLFQKTGCAVCHEAQAERGPRATLKHLGSKTTPSVLAKFIQNPSDHDRAGRMPGFSFANNNDAYNIGWYLTQRDAHLPELTLPPAPDAAQMAAAFAKYEKDLAVRDRFAQAAPEQQLAILAKKSMQSKRCTNCHEFKIPNEDHDWKPRASDASFAKIVGKRHGCLAGIDQPQTDNVPRFGAALNRDAVFAFLETAQGLPTTNAPGEFARLTIERLNCLGCHTRDGNGGLTEKLVQTLTHGLDPAVANAETVSPPPLTGVTEKLQPAYVDAVLTGNKRSRPFMSLQMPRFAADQVKHLSQGFNALDGNKPVSQPANLAFSGATAEAGRTLTGEKGFGCIKCHDMLGIASGGTRGPDLAEVTQRVNYEWYVRWLNDPQRIQPGTRMPTIFLNGRSPHTSILGGDRQQQTDALWSYFGVAKRLPRPEGLNPPKTLHAPEEPAILVQRTFLPETTARGIAIRFPEAIHVAYDAQTARIAYAWSGEFLNMSPAWDNRGGNKAGLEGQVFWQAPAGFPFELTPSTDALADFSGRANDPIFGAQVNEAKPQPASRVQFKGYRTDSARPTMMTNYALANGATAAITESFKPGRTTWALGVERTISITPPDDGVFWCHVAAADQPVLWRSAGGDSGKVEAKSTTLPGSTAVITTFQGRTAVAVVKNTVAGTAWYVSSKDGKSQLVLGVPVKKGVASEFTLGHWSPLDDKANTAETSAQTLLQK